MRLVNSEKAKKSQVENGVAKHLQTQRRHFAGGWPGRAPLPAEFFAFSQTKNEKQAKVFGCFLGETTPIGVAKTPPTGATRRSDVENHNLSAGIGVAPPENPL